MRGFSQSRIFCNLGNLHESFKMKTAAALVIVFAVAFVGADNIDIYLELVKDALMTCAKEHGVTDQSPREMFDKEMAMAMDKSTCLLACVMKSAGMMKDSKLFEEKLATFINTAHADEPDKLPDLLKAMQECADKVKPLTDECKITHSYIGCYMDKTMK